jgi:hypothetical protein
MKAFIGIAAVRDEVENDEDLPLAKIYVTPSGEYLFLEPSIVEEAIALSLKNLKIGKHSLVLVAVEILSSSQRERRAS